MNVVFKQNTEYWEVTFDDAEAPTVPRNDKEGVSFKAHRAQVDRYEYRDRWGDSTHHVQMTFFEEGYNSRSFFSNRPHTLGTNYHLSKLDKDVVKNILKRTVGYDPEWL